MSNDNKNIEFGWQFLRYYGVFRIVIALLLLSLLLFTQDQSSYFNPSLYKILAISYLVVSIILFTLSLIQHHFLTQSILQPLIDILLLAVLAYSGRETTSGFAILMALITIFAVLLIRHRFSLLYSILAVFSILLATYYRSVVFEKEIYLDLSIQIMGILAVSLLANILARRITGYESEVVEHKHSIRDMHQLNRQVIDKMNRGVMVINELKELMFINKTAWFALNLPEDPVNKPLKVISEDLDNQLSLLVEGRIEGKPFRPNNAGPEYIPSFVKLENDKDTLILLDNYSDITKKVQQVKLASLGQLTASIAHEIRNPLSAINQASQMLSENDSNNKQTSELMQIIQRQTKRINKIIENVQMVSKRKIAHRQRLFLDRFLSNFIKEYQQGLKFKSEINIKDVVEELSIEFDQSQLKQVLSNLFDNALKYSFINTKSYKVYLVANYNMKQKQVILDVVDEGPGIRASEISKIFEPFYTTNHDGTGLGLYISKELCEANNAQLDCVPVALGGACFRITFDGETNDE